jgi:hypothetical protein
MTPAKSLREPLDRFADHWDLVEHGGLSLEVAEKRLLGHAVDGISGKRESKRCHMCDLPNNTGTTQSLYHRYSRRHWVHMAL